jgi:radical SAM protein with 4Fe4S-binding SPASM domain
LAEKDFTLKWVAFELTGQCNLNCIHCRSSGGDSAGEEISTARARKVLADLSRMGKPVVVLTGGEPLLRSDVFDLLQYGTELGLRMCIATNGTLLDDSVCLRLKESGVKIMAVSLDGASAQVHNEFRNQTGAFEGAIRGIEFLKKHRIEFLVNSSFTKRNRHSIESTYKLAKELGATAWYMFIVVPTGRARDIQEELIGAKDYEDILLWHYEMEKGERDILVRPTCAPQYYRLIAERMKKGEKFERRTLKFSTGGAKGCMCGQNIAMISRTGDVFGCSYLPVSAGSVIETPFSKIWNESAVLLTLRESESFQVCGRCEYRDVCGGCRVRAHFLKGDITAKDPICTYSPDRL